MLHIFSKISTPRIWSLGNLFVFSNCKNAFSEKDAFKVPPKNRNGIILHLVLLIFIYVYNVA